MAHFRLAILASGTGTNAEAIIRFFRNYPDISVNIVLSNKKEAPVLKKAESAGVENYSFIRQDFYESDVVLDILKQKEITHIILAGFLWLIPKKLIHAFQGRIINIHPALLPAYGGKGMYGRHVHEAVIASGEVSSGITIHEVNEKYDEGKIIFQASIKVEKTDTPESLANKIHQLEHRYYPEVIHSWLSNS